MEEGRDARAQPGPDGEAPHVEPIDRLYPVAQQPARQPGVGQRVGKQEPRNTVFHQFHELRVTVIVHHEYASSSGHLGQVDSRECLEPELRNLALGLATEDQPLDLASQVTVRREVKVWPLFANFLAATLVTDAKRIFLVRYTSSSTD